MAYLTDNRYQQQDYSENEVFPEFSLAHYHEYDTDKAKQNT